MALDRDSLLLLQIHVVKNLIFHIAVGKSLRKLEQTVGKSTLAVVDMSDYAEIAYMFHSYNFL